jgi:hypothetical protein
VLAIAAEHFKSGSMRICVRWPEKVRTCRSHLRLRSKTSEQQDQHVHDILVPRLRGAGLPSPLRVHRIRLPDHDRRASTLHIRLYSLRRQAAHAGLGLTCPRTAAVVSDLECGTIVHVGQRKGGDALTSGILVRHVNPIATGPLEGVNTKTTVPKRQACGYRNQRHFRLKLNTLHLTRQEVVG